MIVAACSPLFSLSFLRVQPEQTRKLPPDCHPALSVSQIIAGHKAKGVLGLAECLIDCGRRFAVVVPEQVKFPPIFPPGHAAAAAPPSAASNSRRPMVTVIRPSRARCVKGMIPHQERAVFTFKNQYPARHLEPRNSISAMIG